MPQGQGILRVCHKAQAADSIRLTALRRPPRPGHRRAEIVPCTVRLTVEEEATPHGGTPSALAGFIVRKARAIVGVTLLLAVIAGFGVSGLRIDQRLLYLLPETFPSVSGVRRATERLGNQQDVYITIRSPSRDANIAFGDAVADELANLESLHWAVFRRDYAYFEDRALLYLPLADVLDLRQQVIEKIQAEVRRQAFGDLSMKSVRAHDLDEDGVKARYGIEDRPPEFFEAEQGTLMVVKARPIKDATDLEFARSLQRELEGVLEATGPTRFHPEMTVRLDGAFVQHTKRIKALKGEVIGGSAAALIALLLSLAVYFRSARAVPLVLGPLLISTVGALAFARVAYGALNLVSAFIFAVLLGLGIDFGIHILARYRDERARGEAPEAAWAVTLATSGRATLAAGLGTAGAFGTLAVADFRGFSQFGVVAAFGIVAALAAALIAMPALVVLTERTWPWPARPRKASTTTARGRTWPIFPSAVAFVLAVGAAGWSAGHARDLEFEFDFGAMGARKDEPTGPAPKDYRDAAGVTLSPAIALTDDLAQARSIYRQLSALQAMTPQEAADLTPIPSWRRPGLLEAFSPGRAPEPKPPPARDENPPDDDDDGLDDPFDDPDPTELRFEAMATSIAGRTYPDDDTLQALQAYEPERRRTMSDRLSALTSLFAFVPDEQDEKLEVIRDIRRRIDEKRGAMSTSGQAEIDEWYRYLRVEDPVTAATLPDWVREQFKDANGDIGRYVVVWAHGSKANYLNSRRIYDALGTVTTDSGEVVLAAEFFVLPEIFEAIQRDAPLVLGLASLAMLLTAFIALRAWGGPLAVAFVVATAILWLVGVMVLLGWKLNYFNVIVLPLLIGMAQDDAIHIYQRWREEGGDRMGLVLRETGGAVFLTTLTTVCGFAGILFANHRGLESMAWVAVAGMVLALISAVIVLPATLQLTGWLGRRNRRG